MNSKVIKFVAGGGKTTESAKYMDKNNNGLYLAFTNSVVQDMEKKGYISKTIDSLFFSFIIPKLTSMIPIINSGAKINFFDYLNGPQHLKGAANIKIGLDGVLYNKTKATKLSMNIDNHKLHQMTDFQNATFIKKIFSKDSLNINNEQLAEISSYIIKLYSNQIIEILSTRFSHIIIDEAQDLRAFREEFAQLLFSSNINLTLLGDDNQNIMGGGYWFESLQADEYKNQSFRCPEKICEWIRINLNIEIYGNSNQGKYKDIDITDIPNLDNGNRLLLYNGKSRNISSIIDNWNGPKKTIKKVKGETIKEDIVIIGNSLNFKNLYTAITRTERNVYSSIKKYNN